MNYLKPIEILLGLLAISICSPIIAAVIHVFLIANAIRSRVGDRVGLIESLLQSWIFWLLTLVAAVFMASCVWLGLKDVIKSRAMNERRMQS